MLSRISLTAKHFYCPELSWDKCNFFFGCLAPDLHSSDLCQCVFSLYVHTQINPSKIGSENVIKQNCCWKEAVKYFQILGEKRGCLGKRKCHIGTITFAQLPFYFVLPIADSEEFTVVAEWIIFFCNNYLITANEILFLIFLEVIWGYFVRGKRKAQYQGRIEMFMLSQM